MAISVEVSNKFKHVLMQGLVDFESDDFHIILMSGEFSFDRDTHDTYSHVSGEEMDEIAGYTATGILLTGGSLTRDNDNDKTVMSWSDPSWTASGEALRYVGGALIYDDTVSGDPVVGYADFGEDLSINNGSVLQLQNVVVNLT